MLSFKNVWLVSQNCSVGETPCLHNKIEERDSYDSGYLLTSTQFEFSGHFLMMCTSLHLQSRVEEMKKTWKSHY